MRLPMTMVVLEHVIKDLKDSERHQGIPTRDSIFPSMNGRFTYMNLVDFYDKGMYIYMYTCKHTSPMDAMGMDRITLNGFGPELSQIFNPPDMRDYCSLIDVYKCMGYLVLSGFFYQKIP